MAQTSEIKKADATGKVRTVQVEVRKKRVFVKRDPNEVTAAAVAAEAPVIAPPPPPPPPQVQQPTPQRGGVDAKQMELREEEARRQKQLADLQATEIRERQEREKKEAEQEAAASGAAAGATTLHAPKPQGDVKTDKKSKKAKPTTILRDDSVRRRQIK